MINLHKKLIGEAPATYNITGAAVLGGGALLSGGAKLWQGSKDDKNARRSTTMGIKTIQDFVDSGEYDPGGSDSESTNTSVGQSGGNSSSQSSSSSGYNLENAQNLLNEWEDTYGGLEDNLSDYYNNLDAGKYAQQYKTNLNENIDTQMQQMNEEMASSGLMTSGMRAQGAKEAAFAKAKGGAEADLMAEDKVMGMKSGFLDRGESRKNMYDNALTGVSSRSNSSSNSSNFSDNISFGQSNSSSRGSNYAPVQDMANIRAGRASDLSKRAGDFAAGGLDDVGSGIGTIAGMI